MHFLIPSLLLFSSPSPLLLFSFSPSLPLFSSPSLPPPHFILFLPPPSLLLFSPFLSLLLFSFFPLPPSFYSPSFYSPPSLLLLSFFLLPPSLSPFIPLFIILSYFLPFGGNFWRTRPAYLSSFYSFIPALVLSSHSLLCHVSLTDLTSGPC